MYRLTFVLLLLCLMSGFAMGTEIRTSIEARDLVASDLLANEMGGKRITVHPDLLAPGTPIETWHETALVTPAAGYVVFVDDMAFANFEHPCRYVFVDQATGGMTVTEATTPPKGFMNWQELNTEAFQILMSGKNMRAPRVHNPTPRYKNNRAGERYAVLMSGGASSGSNHIRYWNDLSNIYITLVDVYEYDDDNIIVLCSDGLNPAADQSNGTNSPPDLDGDGDDDIMYSCVYSNIQMVFSQLATTLTADDQLFIFTTDHGGSTSGWSTYLNLWNSETLPDADLATWIDALPDCEILTTMEQCFSGGFLDDLSANGRVFSSAARYDEYSWAMPPDYVYDTYVFHWTAAMKGEDAYGVPVDADLDGDDQISAYEAFIYAEAHDNDDETPQYDSTPADLGEEMFLAGDPVLGLKVQSAIPTGLCPPGLDTPITVKIKDGLLETYVPGSGYLYYRFDPGHAFTQVPFTAMGGSLYEVTVPNTVPGDQPEFYLSIQGSLGSTLYQPKDWPASAFGFEVCMTETLMKDDFESDLGWTVANIDLTSGAWERGVPVGGGDRQDPADDADGSGKCFVTENVDGDYDVDGGPTLLTSPTIDLTSGDAMISYQVWQDSSAVDPADLFKVELSNNNGASWSVVESFLTTSGWELHSFMVSDVLAPTAQMKVRYSTLDNPSNTVVEGGLDDFRVSRLNYFPTLYADNYAIVARDGGVVNFSLDAGAANGNRQYLLLASASGTLPGLPLPGGGHLPLNWDALTNLVVGALSTPGFTNFVGWLDGTGKAQATLDTLGSINPHSAGITMHFAYFLVDLPCYGSTAMPVDIK